MSDTTKHPIATLSRFIQFHGLELFVYKRSNTEYVPLKAITDAIGIDWRNVKRNLEGNDNKTLYGAIRLITSKIDNYGGLMTPSNPVLSLEMQSEEPKSSNNDQFIDLLCIRLDRVEIFLARVNTTRLRVNGNIESADYLLKLQHEWADALHDYETHGIAIKNTLFENTKQLKALTDIYHKLNDAQQKLVVSKQIDACLNITRTDTTKQPDLLD